MSIDIKVPVFPESITEGTIAAWHKKPGDFAKRDENLVDVETDKVVLEVVAPHDGILEKIIKQQGETVKSDEIIGVFKEGAQSEAKALGKEQTIISKPAEKSSEKSGEALKKERKMSEVTSPSVRRLLGEEKEIKEDIKKPKEEKTTTFQMPKQMMEQIKPGERIEKRVPMTRLRARIAERLLEAQHNAAILTTFNEVNMQPIITLRQKYKESFEKNYGVRLGFMSFFTLSVIEALKQFPIINASVDGNDIIYHGYYDIGIAVSTERGLVVPILRNAETMTMAEIERQIIDLAKKAEKGSLSIEEITGGTFTITNGGVFGSLMATPIINPPQSAILGMHKIQERAVVENGQVVIRPMMYVALSYDHRIIDGADSVRFLVTVKELLEDPARLALGI